MKKYYAVGYLWAFFMLFFLSGCLGPRDDLPEYSREVARVGDIIIKEDALRLRMRLEMNKFPDDFFKDYNGGAVKGHEFLGDMLTRILDKLIDDMIILDYGRAQKIIIPEEELKARFEKRKSAWRADALEEFLQKSEVSYARFKATIEEQVSVQYVLENLLAEETRVSVDEIRKYYNGKSSEFKVGEQVRIRQIVTDTQEKADVLLKRLKGGENFAKLAVNHSLSPDRAKGGDSGYFERGTYPREFDEVCFKLAKGEISNVVKSDYGYHIFKLLDKRPAHVMTLLEATPIIQQRLYEEKMLKIFPKWMEDARKGVSITVHENILESFTL